jgi:hypothetical protein
MSMYESDDHEFDWDNYAEVYHWYSGSCVTRRECYEGHEWDHTTIKWDDFV